MYQTHMICSWIVCNIFSKPKLTCLPRVKWFQVLLFNANDSIQYPYLPTPPLGQDMTQG